MWTGFELLTELGKEGNTMRFAAMIPDSSQDEPGRAWLPPTGKLTIPSWSGLVPSRLAPQMHKAIAIYVDIIIRGQASNY